MNDNDGANMKNDSKHDDDFCQRLIGPLKDDVAPPNRDLMAAAIAKASDAFTAGEDPDDSVESHPKIQTKERRTMFSFVRPLAALVASAAAVFIMVALSKGASADANLGDVLDRLRTSKSLQLLIKQADGESEVFITGNSVRWQDSDHRYRIARGSRLWEIDESQNTVADSKNPWTFDTNESIDLLALLGSKSSNSLRAVESSEQLQHAGKLCNVFFFQPCLLYTSPSPRD